MLLARSTSRRAAPTSPPIFPNSSSCLLAIAPIAASSVSRCSIFFLYSPAALSAAAAASSLASAYCFAESTTRSIRRTFASEYIQETNTKTNNAPTAAAINFIRKLIVHHSLFRVFRVFRGQILSA
jgi:hypothetical protein